MANCLYAATRSTATDYTGRRQALDHDAPASTRESTTAGDTMNDSRHPAAACQAMVDNTSGDTVQGLRRPMYPNLRPTFANQTMFAEESRHTVGLRRPCAAMGDHGPSMGESLPVEAFASG